MVLIKGSLDHKIIGKKIDSLGRFMIIHIEIDDKIFVLVNIYAPNTDKEQLKYYEDLLHVVEGERVGINGNIVMGGDWNLVQNTKIDKKGGLLQTKESIKVVENITSRLQLVDIWRLQNPLIRRYTWRQKQAQIHCRLDYWIISYNLMDWVTQTTILPSFQSDHSPISLTLKYLDDCERGKGYWKMNTNLLQDKMYQEQFEAKLPDWLEKYKKFDDLQVWGLIKYEIWKFSITYIKEKVKEKHKLEKKFKSRTKRFRRKTRLCG